MTRIRTYPRQLPSKTMLSIIAAVAKNRVIGKDNTLLWHLPDDMRHFRETTRGKPVIMGRKTWESLPDAFRPLPGRHNIVVSHNATYEAPGATLVGSLGEAVEAAGNVGEIFVIGGETLYQQAIPLAQRLYLTEIDQDFGGDAYFPAFSREDWAEVSRTVSNDRSGPEFSFVLYQHRCSQS